MSKLPEIHYKIQALADFPRTQGQNDYQRQAVANAVELGGRTWRSLYPQSLRNIESVFAPYEKREETL